MVGDLNQRATGFQTVEKSSDISLRDVVTPLFRRRRVLLLTFLSVLAVVILGAAVKGPPIRRE